MIAAPIAIFVRLAGSCSRRACHAHSAISDRRDDDAREAVDRVEPARRNRAERRGEIHMLVDPDHADIPDHRIRDAAGIDQRDHRDAGTRCGASRRAVSGGSATLSARAGAGSARYREPKR